MVPIKAFQKVVHNLFNTMDGADIMKRVRDPLPKHGIKYTTNMNKLSQDRVCWKHGVEVILTFNMNIQDDFLADFVKAFQKVDAHHDGTLTAGELQQLVNIYGNLDWVQDGSLEYTMLADATNATLRNIKKFRRLTFSETTVQFIDMLNARWALSERKGKRYEYHDRLKTALVYLENEKERNKLAAEEYARKSARQKRIAEARDDALSDPNTTSKLSKSASKSGLKAQSPTPSNAKTVKF